MSLKPLIEKKYLINGPHSEAKMEIVDKNIQEIISGGTNKFTYDSVVLKPYAKAYLGITLSPETRLSEDETTYEEEWRDIGQNSLKKLYPDEFLEKPDTIYLLYKDESSEVVRSYEKIFLDEFSGFIDADEAEVDAEKKDLGMNSYYLYLFLQYYMK
ncbi:hypothetical protein [Methanolacinia paynteri]|uniref:hypothetical protein n=1 Tax=Methanolacinia paynteri TaxID=230356 RepID=UPI00064F823E|nr:hypothetical protein [Methanolacinia paynteri]